MAVCIASGYGEGTTVSNVSLEAWVYSVAREVLSCFTEVVQSSDLK